MLRARARRLRRGGAAGADPTPEGGAALARAGRAVARRDAVRVDESRETGPGADARRCGGRPARGAGNAALARSVTVPSRDRGGSRDATRSPSSRGFAPATAGRGDYGRPRRDCSGFGLSGRLRNGNGSRHRSCVPCCRAAGPPVGGPAAPVVVCHSACEMGRSPKRGRVPPAPAREADPSASASPVALLSCASGRRPDGRLNADRPTGRSQIYKNSGLTGGRVKRESA